MPLDECPMALALKEGDAYNNRPITIETPDHIIKNPNGICTADF